MASAVGSGAMKCALQPARVLGGVRVSEAKLGGIASSDVGSSGRWADCAALRIPGNRAFGRRNSVRLEVTNSAATKSPAEAEWKTKREALLKAKVRSVSPKEAIILQKEQGYTIIDVRPDYEYKEAHPAGAINVQVYRLIKEWTAWDIARRAAFAFFGIFQGTEENPEFANDFGDWSWSFASETTPEGYLCYSHYQWISEVGLELSKDSPILLACSMGGTLRPSSGASEGKESRSLIAAYLLTLEGYTNVLHLEGGIRTWFKEELPVEALVEE